MLRNLFFCFCGALAAPTVNGQIEKVKSTYEYQLMTAYSDEFSGTTLNSLKWRDWDGHMSRDISHQGFTYANPNCVKVETGSDGAGVLKLIAKKGAIDADNGWSADLKHYFYQTGMIASRAYYQYGYYEIRAKIPKVRNTNGMAFWFWHEEDTTYYSELDVFETQPIFKYRYPTALHYSTIPGNSYEYNQQECDTVSTDITEGWHTYGVEWGPDAISFYIDGIIVQRYTNLTKSGSSVGVSALGKMRLLINNSANFGIEASTSGDVMEVDYIRYYKRKPTIAFFNYNASTGHYTYLARTNTPTDVITWLYDASKITDVTTYSIADVQFIKFKRVSASGAIQLTARATQPLVLEAPDATTNLITQSSIYVGNDNPYFYVDDAYYSAGKNAIKVYASAVNPNSQWSVGLKNTDGTVDWTSPQTQYGASATFTNLLSGKTYVIKHGVYGGTYLTWTETTKEVAIKFNPEFILDYTTIPFSSSNTLNMVLHQVSSNPNSEWHIGLVNTDGTINTSVDQPQWGQTATFTGLLPGKNYKVTHGNYGTGQAWIESSKIIYVDFESNFEFYNTEDYKCSGAKPKLCIEGGIPKLYVYSHEYANPSFTNYSSSYAIYELDADGNYGELDPPLYSAVNGKDVKLTVDLNKSYMIKRGVYAPNGYWTETRKTIRTLEEYADCASYLTTNDELSHPEIHTDLLGIIENEQSEIKIYPNPAEAVLHIQQISQEYQTATLLDPSGRVVLNNLSLENGNIDISQLSKGTYILRLESTTGGFKTFPVSKQ